jgi:hypothetical protein
MPVEKILIADDISRSGNSWARSIKLSLQTGSCSLSHNHPID